MSSLLPVPVPALTAAFAINAQVSQEGRNWDFLSGQVHG